jgi:L-seryl-tRNA(Ser) seleniumtransferase
LTGAEAGLAVNNNAAALVLALAALAAPEGVAVSRGELIEIGGSFRLPELMAASGARLVEVGTTNRTRLADYERALEAVAAILKVHPSNYRVEGFSESVGYRDLGTLAEHACVPFIADVGSGLLDARTPWLDGSPPGWLADEPGVRQALDGGAGIVLFSGDKLLGGPQSGVIVGRADLVRRMATHPLMRAMRLDGPTLAALTVTLELYGSGRGAEIPFWHMAMLDEESLRPRLERLLPLLGGQGEIVMGESVPGAGSVPGETIRTPVLAIADRADFRWRRLLDAHPPILAWRNDQRLVIDLRTVATTDDSLIAAALA